MIEYKITVFGKNVSVFMSKDVGDPYIKKVRAANAYQGYLEENLGLDSSLAYAVICIGFGLQYNYPIPKELKYHQIYLVTQAVPDNLLLGNRE